MYYDEIKSNNIFEEKYKRRKIKLVCILFIIIVLIFRKIIATGSLKLKFIHNTTTVKYIIDEEKAEN